MNRTREPVPWRYTGLFGLAVAFTLTATLESAAQVQRYLITPGSQYTYFPPPEGPGIPGGVPSQYQLDFGVSGFFSVQHDGPSAALLDVDLDLSGNEMVQQDPPPFGLVTADRVADWLEDRMLVQLAILPPWDQYADQTYHDFRLKDFLNGTITLEGGFDFRPLDGPGMQFDVSAVAIPEPATLPLVLVALAGGIVAAWLRAC